MLEQPLTYTPDAHKIPGTHPLTPITLIISASEALSRAQREMSGLCVPGCVLALVYVALRVHVSGQTVM